MGKRCLVINLDRCTGCDGCIVACKFENNLTLGNYYNRVLAVGPTGTYPDVEMYYLPVQCQQCQKAHCIEVCPTGASYRDENGVVLINKDKCIGCQYCVYACPFGVRSFNEGEGVAQKCTLCNQLTADGSDEPVCVHNCPGGARFFGDLDDPNSPASQELARYDEKDIHHLPCPNNEQPLTCYIMTERFAHWKELS